MTQHTVRHDTPPSARTKGLAREPLAARPYSATYSAIAVVIGGELWPAASYGSNQPKSGRFRYRPQAFNHHDQSRPNGRNHLALAVIVALAVAVAVIIFAVVAYNGRIDRVKERLPADVWSSACVDPVAPRRWHAVVVGSEGIKLTRGNGSAVAQWTWLEIAPSGPTARLRQMARQRNCCCHHEARLAIRRRSLTPRWR
jgi:hypothetical protein